MAVLPRNRLHHPSPLLPLRNQMKITIKNRPAQLRQELAHKILFSYLEDPTSVYLSVYLPDSGSRDLSVLSGTIYNPSPNLMRSQVIVLGELVLEN